MKVDFKKLAASALSIAVLASLGGCAMLDKDDDAVIDAADAYAKAVTTLKANKIAGAMADADDAEDEITAMTSPDTELDQADYSSIVSVIEGSLEYELDEESVESSKKNGEASVNVVYTIIDYASAYEDFQADGGDVDAFVDSLSGADTVEIEQTINLVLEDGEWLIKDKKLKNLSEIYAFYDDVAGYSFVTPISTDLIDSIEWYYSDDGVYTNVYNIELDIIPTTEGQDYSLDWAFTYEIYLDGELIFTSDEMHDSGAWIESYYGEDYDSQVRLSDEGYLVAGDYRCVVYDLAGNVLADSTCTVETESYVTPEPVAEGDVTEDSWANAVNPYWYYYHADGDSSSMETGDYTTDESIIEYTCEVLDESLLSYFPVYYEVWYTADGDMDNAEEVHSATITPTEYSNGYFYEFQYVADDTLDAGTYYLVGATDSTGDVLLFFETATVV